MSGTASVARGSIWPQSTHGMKACSEPYFSCTPEKIFLISYRARVSQTSMWNTLITGEFLKAKSNITCTSPAMDAMPNYRMSNQRVKSIATF
eukprot:1372183-Amphidinium_carterae.1